MGGAAQVAMRVASQIWQVVFASQTLQVFWLALRKKAQYVVDVEALLESVRVHSLTLSFTPGLPLGPQPCKPLPWSRAHG
jgi:hypothetical protein